MKAYRGEKKRDNKRWCIELIDHMNGVVELAALDSDTGNTITTLIIFPKSGNPVLVEERKRILEIEGYDPNEHGNIWDNKGRLKFDSMESSM